MKCPVCSVDLVMSERQGVEIDYCPRCRGVWLDRGELDKIVERAGTLSSAERPEVPPQRVHRHDEDERRGKKRESFWSELFDFG